MSVAEMQPYQMATKSVFISNVLVCLPNVYAGSMLAANSSIKHR